MYTPEQTFEAIKALKNCDWDNKQLKRLGALFPDEFVDILYIIENATTEQVTKILFLKEKNTDGILAVFPNTIRYTDHMIGYTDGKFHDTDIDYCKGLKEATKEQYRPLLKKLLEYGYDLEILNRTGFKFQ